MISSIFLLSADFALGRLDSTLMSPQACMEAFISGVQNKQMFTDKSGNFLDFEEWDGIQLDDDKNVIAVYLKFVEDEEEEEYQMKGTVHLSFLPDTLQKIELGCNALRGI